MSTGHTTYTTFHADSVGEVLKRFTTDPINVSKTMFTALDLVSVQSQTRTGGRKVRRTRTLTEIREYDAEDDEITVQDVYEWEAETDTFVQSARSGTLEEIAFDRGWDESRLRRELFERRVVLAYLVDRGLNSYAEVAATVQGYMHDPDTILGLMATDRLAESLADLRDMETVLVDVDEAKEAMVPRPDPDRETRETASRILDRAETHLFDAFDGGDGDLAGALPGEAAGASPVRSGTAEPTVDGSFDWNTQGGTAGLSDVPERAGETTLPPSAGPPAATDDGTDERAGVVESLDAVADERGTDGDGQATGPDATGARPSPAPPDEADDRDGTEAADSDRDEHVGAAGRPPEDGGDDEPAAGAVADAPVTDEEPAVEDREADVETTRYGEEDG
jgi:flagellar protein FlaI